MTFAFTGIRIHFGFGRQNRQQVADERDDLQRALMNQRRECFDAQRRYNGRLLTEFGGSVPAGCEMKGAGL